MHTKTYIISDNFLDFEKAINSLKSDGISYLSFSSVPISLDSKKINSIKAIQSITMIFGIFGFVIATYFQFWAGVLYYKMNLGGKPFFGAITSVPFSFEIAVLFAGIALFTLLFFLIFRSTHKIDKEDRVIIQKYAGEYFVIVYEE